MEYNYCLYCGMEHYPFCMTNCKDIDINNSENNVITCDCLYDPEFSKDEGIITVKDIRSQRSWLKTDSGKRWIEEMLL